MLTSTERIITTHVGSLPRSPAVVDVLLAEDQGAPRDPAADLVLTAAVNDTLRRQAAAGIDVVSDGEMSKISYATYIRHRLSGFVPAELPRAVPADLDRFPSYKDRLARSGGTPTYLRPICQGPVAFVNREPLDRDLARLRAAVSATAAAEAFMNAPSPGVVAIFQPNEYYATEREYLEALSEALRVEYQAIVDAGFVLQVDCPDLALGRHTKGQHASEEEFLRGAEERIEILNGALDGIPSDRIRAHVCWGNYEGPHHLDLELRRLLPTLARLRVGALLVEAANPRHAHEWELWGQAQLPDGSVVIPGVIDTTTNYVEHPALVAQRICQIAGLVGRERVIAGTDCGFGTFAGFGAVDPEIAYAKLETLVTGAALASERLW